jgi:hypothetical protein
MSVYTQIHYKQVFHRYPSIRTDYLIFILHTIHHVHLCDTHTFHGCNIDTLWLHSARVYRQWKHINTHELSNII